MPSIGVAIALLSGTAYGVVQASDQDPLDAVRRSTSPDAAVMDTWIDEQITALGASTAPDRFRVFTTAFRRQRLDSRNTTAFVRMFTSRTARAAERVFAKPEVDATTAQAVARVLRDMNRVERVPGVVAGLGSNVPEVRYLCAAALADQVEEIASGRPEERRTVITALQTTGLSETNAVVLSHVYRALAYPTHVAEVLPAHLAIFDKRLAARRSGSGVVQCAELSAFEFFRDVAGGLNAAEQKALVARLAVFLRLDVERYGTRFGPTVMAFSERDCIERRVDAVEATLAGLTGKPRPIEASELLGAAVLRDEAGARQQRAALLASLHAWIGDVGKSKPGVLNDARWGVPVGAP